MIIANSDVHVKQPDWSIPDEVFDISISADGSVVAVATIYDGLKVYDAAGRLLWHWGDWTTGSMTSVGVSDDGNVVVAALHVRDYEDYVLFWKNAKTLNGNPPPDWSSRNLYGRIGAEALAVSSGGRQVVAVGTGENIFYWNDTFTLSGSDAPTTWSGYLIHYTLEYVDISNDGDTIAILGGLQNGKNYNVSAFVYKNCKSRVGWIYEGYNLSYNFGIVIGDGGIALSDDGLYAVAGVGGGSVEEGGKIYFFNTSMSESWTPQWICYLKKGEWVAAIDMSGDGNTVLAATNSYFMSPHRLAIFQNAVSKMGTVSVDDEFIGASIYTIHDYFDVSIDGLGRLAVAGTGDYVFAINVLTGELLWIFNGTYPCVSCIVKASKNGSFAVAAGKYLDSAYFFRLGDYVWTQTIIIEADGSVTPAGAPILTYDNITYMLISNIINAAPSKNDVAIRIRRSNIVLDGSGNILQGTNGDQSKGVLMSSGVSNVTIRNMTIKQFYYGIYLCNCSYNMIFGSIIINNNRYGVWLSESSTYNTIYGNLLINNTRGIQLSPSCHHNTITENRIENNDYGISLDRSLHNLIFQNNIKDNYYGLYLSSSSNNKFYYNSLVNNFQHAVIRNSTNNIWDDGYPSGGNYWSSYMGLDLYSGPYQNESGSDCLGDIPYIIDENNTDSYPLTAPWSLTPIKIFDVVWEDSHYSISVISNSTITHFTFNQSLAQISFKISGSSGATGYCNITIPKGLMRGSWSFTFSGEAPSNVSISESENEMCSLIYITYTHASIFQITIRASWVISEYPLIIIPLMLVISTIMILMKKRRVGL